MILIKNGKKNYRSIVASTSNKFKSKVARSRKSQEQTVFKKK
jgi:hypothetical protein